jgi:hypothetical protein
MCLIEQIMTIKLFYYLNIIIVQNDLIFIQLYIHHFNLYG